MALTAVTLLGENTVPILDVLCRRVGDVAGIEVAAVPAGGNGDDRARAVAADVVWACGYLLCELIDRAGLDAEIVAAPVFPGERGPAYHSVIVAADPAIASVHDAAGRRVAVNEAISWSGHHALVRHLASIGADPLDAGRVVVTGSHRASVEAVVQGRADLASIDHTVWAHALASGAVDPALRVVGRTRDWPAPPFAVAGRVDPAVRSRVVAALTSTSADTVPGLDAVVPANRADYDPLVPSPPAHPSP